MIKMEIPKNWSSMSDEEKIKYLEEHENENNKQNKQ